MRATLSAIALATVCSLAPGTAHAQLVRGFKYMYNEIVPADSTRAQWLKFVPVGTAGGSPQACLTYDTVMLGLPDKTLFAPSWEQRQAEIYLFYKYQPSVTLSHVQIIRHSPALPVRDSTSAWVIDPFTPLTAHTVFLVDLIDSTMIAYNRIAGTPQRGVAGKMSAVRDLPFVRETLHQIDDAWAMCQMKAPR